MSDNFVQIAVGAAPAGTGTDTATLTGVTAGNTIVAWLWDGNTTVTPATKTVADAQGSYTIEAPDAIDVTNNVWCEQFKLENANAGTHVVVGNVPAGHGCFIVAAEISTTASPSFSGANSQFQNNPGTAADAVSSLAATVTGNATLMAMSTDSASASTSNEPTIGTGFTSRANGANGTIGAWRVESKAVAANAAGTFKAVTGTDSFVTAAIAILNGATVGDQPQDGDQKFYEVEEDYDHHEGTTEPIAFGGNQNIPQSYEAEWSEEDYDAHDGSTDPVIILAALTPPPIQSYEADFLWDGDDDLDIIDDYANFNPDQPQDEIPEFIDDDYDHHIGEDQPQYLVQVQATAQPQDVILEDEDDYEHHQDVDQPQYLNVSPLQNFDPILDFEEEDYDPPDVSVDAQAIVIVPDPNIPQSYEALWDDEDYDPQDLSTDPVPPVVVVAPDQPQSIEAEWIDDDYDDPDVSTGQAALGGDNNIPQSFEALWDEEDYDAHDGSGEGQPATIVDNNIPQSFVAEWDEEDYDEANGSTDPQPVVIIDNNIPQSYEAEWAEEDYQEDDTNVLLPLAGITSLNLIPGQWTWTGISVTGSFTPGGGGGGLGVLGPLDWPPNYVAMLDDNGKDVAPWVKWFNDVRQRVLDLQTIIVNSGIASPFFPPFINVKDETGAYTLVAGDWDPKTPTMIRMNSAAPQNLTFPAATVGAVVGWMQYGTGALTLVGAMGVTLRTSGTLTARVQYSSGTALMVSATEWLIEGDTT